MSTPAAAHHRLQRGDVVQRQPRRLQLLPRIQQPPVGQQHKGLHPLIAAGWVAGLVEASLRKPQVKDFLALKDDIISVRGFFRNRITRLLLLVAVVAPAAPDASPALWPDVVREVSGVLERAAKAYEANDPKGAQELVGEAYFGAFEERGMEAAVRREISARRARDLEKMFGEIRRAIGTGEPAPGVRRRITIGGSLADDG